MHAVAIIYNRCCLPGVARDAALFRSEKKTLTIRNTWFPDRAQIRMFPPNRIEFDSIHKKWIVSIQKCPSLIRALNNERNMNSRSYYYMRHHVLLFGVRYVWLTTHYIIKHIYNALFGLNLNEYRAPRVLQQRYTRIPGVVPQSYRSHTSSG